MLPTLVIVIICLGFAPCSTASVTVTANGPSPLAEYYVIAPDSFNSNGIHYKPTFFSGVGNGYPSVKVTETLSFGTTPTTFVQMSNLSGVEVDLPPLVDSLTVHFIDTCTFCDPSGIVVNGVSSITNSYDKLRYLPTTIANGVGVSISGSYPVEQVLTLTGPLDTFAIGGPGVTIFSLSFHAVPEPAALSTMCVGLIPLLSRRRRQS